MTTQTIEKMSVEEAQSFYEEARKESLAAEASLDEARAVDGDMSNYTADWYAKVESAERYAKAKAIDVDSAHRRLTQAQRDEAGIGEVAQSEFDKNDALLRFSLNGENALSSKEADEFLSTKHGETVFTLTNDEWLNKRDGDGNAVKGAGPGFAMHRNMPESPLMATLPARGGIFQNRVSPEIAYQLDYVGGVAQAAAIETMDYLSRLEHPTKGMETSPGVELAELAASGDADHQEFAFVEMEAERQSSEKYLLSRERLSGSRDDLVAIGNRVNLGKLVRRQNLTYTKTTAGAAAAGLTDTATEVVAGSVSNITVDNLLDLKNTIDPAYIVGNEGYVGSFTARSGAIGFMMHQDTWNKVEKIQQDNKYIFATSQDGYAGEGTPPRRLFGYPVWINQAMDDPDQANNAYEADDLSIVFGNLGYYVILYGSAIEVIRYSGDTNTARAGTEIETRQWSDGAPVGGGAVANNAIATTAAYQALKQATS